MEQAKDTTIATRRLAKYEYKLIFLKQNGYYLDVSPETGFGCATLTQPPSGKFGILEDGTVVVIATLETVRVPFKYPKYNKPAGFKLRYVERNRDTRKLTSLHNLICETTKPETMLHFSLIVDEQTRDLAWSIESSNPWECGSVDEDQKSPFLQLYVHRKLPAISPHLANYLMHSRVLVSAPGKGKTKTRPQKILIRGFATCVSVPIPSGTTLSSKAYEALEQAIYSAAMTARLDQVVATD